MKFIGHEMVCKKYFGIAAVLDGMERLRNIHIEAAANKINRQNNRSNQENSLKRIGNNNRFQTTSESVAPYQQQTNHNSKPKRNAHFIKNKFLQNNCN